MRCVAASQDQDPSPISVLHQRCSQSDLGLTTSRRRGASVWPSANCITVRRECRLEGHSVGVVGSMLASKFLSDFVSASMIIDEGLFTTDSDIWPHCG